MVHTHNMNTLNTQRPSVPGSRKAEGAKNPRVSRVQLNVCTYNVRTLKDPEKEEELEQELTGFKWDIIGLSETRKKGEQLKQLQSGHVLYTKGEDESVGGVGFLVNKNIKDRVIEYEGEGSRVTSLTLKVNSKYQLQVIQVYAPTSSHSDEEVEELYEEIGKSMEKNKSQYKIVMGDFNAKVGQHHQSDGATVGKFGLGERNERGTRLVQFAKSKGLKIGNTFYRKRKIRKWTWISPNGETRNEIDYILANKNMIQNVNVIKRVNIGSDHRMVRSKIKMNTRLERMKMMRPKGVKVNINTLKQKENEFQLKLQNRFEALQEEESLEEMALNITKTIKDCAMETAGKEERRGEEKLKQETKELLKERRAMAKKDLNDQDRREYNKLCQTIRKRLREDLREHNTRRVKEAIESGKGLKRAKEKEGYKVLISALKEQDGTVITNRERILERCAEFYETLYKDAAQNIRKDKTEDVPSILDSEIEHAIKGMK
uniref:Endonuclease/exonuclease/phosphatase domain-containing protein n=1 Tax=Oryzias latipes TaxID=8090 RepID=A0A3P9KP93_ORYLA